MKTTWKQVVLGMVAGLVAVTTWAGNGNRMVILVQDVETPTTRAAQGKYLDVKTKQMTSQETALTDADRATLDPEALGRIREQEIEDRLRDRRVERDNLERDNRRRQEIADMLRAEAMGTDAGRNVIQAKDWLTEALSPYRSMIQVIDRTDMDFAQDETARNEQAQTMYGGVTHLMRVIVGDMSTSTTSAESYGVKTERTLKKLNVSVTISDLYNRQVFSQSFTATKSDTATSFGGTTGGDDHEDLLRDALRQAGPAIGTYFSARLTVEVVGPKDAPDFDATYAILRVDGQDYSPGEVILLPKGSHTIQVEMDGYKPVEQTIQLSGDLQRKILMAPVDQAAQAE